MDAPSRILDDSPRIQPAVSAPRSTEWLSRIARSGVKKKFASLEDGALALYESGKVHRFGNPNGDLGTVKMRVHNAHFYADLAFGGSIGAAESYMRGDWSCSDLTGLVRLLSRNRHVLQNLESGLGRLTAPINAIIHKLHRNTRAGSRRNIAAHYDLSNDFFELFLDSTMMYSAGIFESPTTTLKEASDAKNERICRKLQLTAHDHLVEIGTGWGGFAIHAASRYGCRVTTTTISQEQYDLACKRVRDAGLTELVTVLLEDYRDLNGRFDKLVSIEMIEAVGHQYYDEYFKTCSDLLEDNGSMLIQAITIDDRQYASAIRSVDFIQRYIFPGSNIPSLARISQALRDATDMKLFHLEDMTEDYATTLKIWDANFKGRIDDVRQLGFSEEFIRMWEFYFAYCEGGFREHVIGSVQMLFTKPAARRPALRGQLEGK
jgi:cyclopropane-fatty-acyl-phospholipid synthase